jgi:hypothetical protein
VEGCGRYMAVKSTPIVRAWATMVRMSSQQEAPRGSPSGIIGAAALLLTLGGVLLWLAMLSGPVKLATGLLEAKSQLDKAQRNLTDGEFEPALEETLVARAAAERARDGLRSQSPLLDLATLSPRVADAVGELDHVVSAAFHATEAAVGTADIGLHALSGPERVIGDDPSGKGSLIRLDRLAKMGSVLKQVQQHLRVAGDEFAAIDLSKIPRRLHRSVRDGLAEARDADEVLDDAVAGFELLPAILGADGPRNYMLGFQNSAELRGTGGAMLQFEFLTIDNGKPELSSEKAGSVYKLDQERRSLSIPLPKDAWYVRGLEDAQRFGNSNWSPDWPLSARLSVGYGRASAERCVPSGEKECPAFPEIDGVLALDPMAVRKVMPGLGPFKQGRFFVTRKTIVNLLLNRAYQVFPIPGLRRGFLGNVVERLFEKMFNPDAPGDLVEGVGRSLAEKNMQIWMADAEEQAFVERMGWDGSISKGSRGDYWQVVEQNVGGNKLDFTAHQTVEMAIDIEGRDALHSSEVSVSNDVPLPQPRWFLGDTKGIHRPMLNLYVPEDAELLSANAGRLCPPLGEAACNGRIDAPATLATWTGGRPPEHFERGKKVWSGTLQIPPRESGSLEIDHRSPDAVFRREGRSVYRLVVQRQPRINPQRLLIQLNLPPDASDIQARGFKKDGRTLTLDRQLRSDTILEVSWRS